MKMLKLARLLAASLVLAALSSGAQAQTLYNQIPFYPGSIDTLVAPATPAVHTVKSSAGYILHVSCFNILATPVYIKLFNVASGSITLGTTSATLNLMCPGNTAGAGFVTSYAWPISFGTAINYAVTGAISLTDNTAITATSVIVDVEYL